MTATWPSATLWGAQSSRTLHSGLSLLLSFAISLLHILMVLRLSFCPETLIPHFFCELAQLLTVACSDTFINNLLLCLIAAAIGMISISGIIFSYSQIVSLVLKIPSAQGKQKAFSTCGSHLSIVSLFYGQCLGCTLVLQSQNLPWFNRIQIWVGSLQENRPYLQWCTLWVPQLMNPFVYSPRKKGHEGSLEEAS